jgi:hypothetical protein
MEGILNESYVFLAAGAIVMAIFIIGYILDSMEDETE